MKVLVINGSPRINGNTAKVLKQVEQEMLKLDKRLYFTYINLGDVQLNRCLGCYACLDKGEELCPLKDERDNIFELMDDADCYIFATPVYVANVSATFKNYLDRFAFICHRPRYYGKKGMVVSTTGSVASGIVNLITKFSVETWGINVVSKIGAIVSPNISAEDQQKQEEENEKKIVSAAHHFYKHITETKKEKAGFVKLVSYHLQKKSFTYADTKKRDYKYWNEKGWLNKNCKFYYDVRVNPLKNLIAKFVALNEAKKFPRGVQEEI